MNLPKSKIRSLTLFLLCVVAESPALAIPQPEIAGIRDANRTKLRALALNQTSFRLQVGDVVEVSAPQESIEFLRIAKASRALASPDIRFSIGVNPDGSRILLAIPFGVNPGEYSVSLSASNQRGDDRVVTIQITVDPLPTVAASAQRPPVVLLNGWQSDFSSRCPIGKSPEETFGTAYRSYLADVPQVYWFDNCVQCPNCKIEDLGARLGSFINSIRYTNGESVPEVDLVAHSMGGLIIRAYLAGLNSDGSLNPPVSHKVRKVVQIASPNFGSFTAPDVGIQASEMSMGSRFLWNLATWNQRNDDLRGVDAVAIIGNRGTTPRDGLSTFTQSSDGVVTVTSASLTFARDHSRTRVLNYCHIDSSTELFIRCIGSSIAKAAETWQVVRAFLNDDVSGWNIGQTPATAAGRFGGLHLAAEDVGATTYVGDLRQQIFAGANLIRNDSSSLYSADFVPAGAAVGQFTSQRLGTVNFSGTIPQGTFAAMRVKLGPVINWVAPLFPGTARIVRSGSEITIGGSSFGTRCPACSVVLGQSESLRISSWNNDAITVTLPALSGYIGLTVIAATGRDFVNFMASAPPLPNVTISPERVSFSAQSGGSSLPQQSLTVSSSGSSVPFSVSVTGAPWLTVSPSSGATPATLTLTVNPAGLPPGNYDTGRLIVTSVGTANGTVSVPITLTVSAAPSSVKIASVTNGASFTEGFTSSTWVTISGSNLATNTRTWRDADFVGGRLPVSLDGVRVSINGVSAYVYFISPNQLNVLAPVDPAIPDGDRLVTVRVDAPSGVATFQALRRSAVAPALFMVDSKHPAAVHTDGSVVAPIGLFPSSRPAKPGDYVALYATGLGATNPAVPAGQIFSAAAPLANAASVSVGGINAIVSFAGMVSPGLYQINIQVPAVADGDQPISIRILGAASQGNVILTVRR